MAELQKKSFLQQLYDTKLKYNLPKDVVDDIKDSVDKMIGNIAVKLGEHDKSFEISHRHLAGSMAEGTSIVQPEEFDYLLILKHLSQAGALQIYKQTEEQRSCYADCDFSQVIVHESYGYTNCHAHIKPGNTNIAEMFSACIIEEYIGNYKLNLKFNECVRSVLESTGNITGKTGTLSINASAESSEGSASTFTLKWIPSDIKNDEMSISIDLVPAIEIHGIAPAILDYNMEAYNASLVEHNKYLVIPGKLAQKCFLYTFTKTEVSIVRSLSENHKTCYMLLKYLLKIRVTNRVISSYMAKTFVLKHAVTCTNDDDLNLCIRVILENINTSFGTRYTDPSLKNRISIRSDVRCIFMNTNYISPKMYDGGECHAIVDALTEVSKRLDDIEQQQDSPDYCFETNFQKLDIFVRRLTQHRYVLKLNIDHHPSFKVNDYDFNL